MTGEGGGLMMGSMYWELGLKSTISQDTAKAKISIDDLEKSTTKADTSILKLTGTAGRSATEGIRAPP